MHIPILSKLIKDFDEALPHADPRTRHWFLLWNSPVYVWALSVSYLLIVWLGPKVMAKRQPLKLQSFLVVYNISLVILSLYMVIETVLGGYQAGYGIFCNGYSKETPNNPAEMRIAKVLWWYFFSKAIEFMDTILMIVRKKNNQISFLHVYHHVSMLNIWWWVMMFIPGGLSCFGAWVNMVVHVVMYLYYGLSAIPSLRKYLWWKRYLTMFQLVQFVVNLTHSLITLFISCAFPIWGQVLLSGYMVSLLILFGNFYIRSYLGPKHHSSASGKTNPSTMYKMSASNGAHLNGQSNGESNGITHRYSSTNIKETD